jgi:replicative DNA helicase
MASYVAREEYVLVFTLEMDITSIATRLVSQAARVHIQDIQSGECDMSLLQRSLKEISSLKMFIDDRGGLTVEEIVATAINYSKKYKIGLVVVDYLQMVKVDTKKARHEAVANVSLELKNLAKALNCCVVAASQLNRQCESRGKETGDYMPSLSDIRDSGAIEQDADVIVFLSRHEFFEPESCPAHRRGIADISVAKNRNGATGIVHLSWHGSWTKFSDKEINHHGKSKEKNSKEKSYQIVGSKVVGGELTSSVNATTPPIADRDLFDEMLDDNFL